MKIIFCIVAVFLLFICSNAQSKTISKDEYDQAFRFAVTETNAAYPFVFKVTTKFIKNGKTVRTVTEVRENQSQGYERIKITDNTNGKTTNMFQTKVGFGNVFCSNDGKTWKASKYECSGPVMLYGGGQETESVEYSVTEKSMNGKKVKIYREYSMLAPSEKNGKREFREEISTIDSRGFFISVVDTEGMLEPKTVTLIREQVWITNAKIKPIVAPIK